MPPKNLRENFRGQVQNIEIHEHFLPRKFPAIRYYVDVPPGNIIMHKQCFHLSQSYIKLHELVHNSCVTPRMYMQLHAHMYM